MTAATSQSQTSAGPLPTGTVTFLFTDIEGSTERWERRPEVMRAALLRHDALLREAIEAAGGEVFKTVGDAFCAAFPTAGAAVGAALAGQRALAAEDWGAFGEGFAPLKIRMALHTGEAEERDGDYFGPPVNRVARLETAAGGGQVLLSAATERLVREALPAGAWLRDHGEHRLKDLRFTEHIYQLLAEGLPERPGELRTVEASAGNLPIPATRFIGRAVDLRNVSQLLTSGRMVTLMGPGGVGKTRLAIEAAWAVCEHYRNGAWLVDLAPARTGQALEQAASVALAVPEASAAELRRALINHLAPKETLLLFDNCEQIIDECADLIADLLQRCPGVRILATSRHILRLPGEQVWAVRPFAIPDAGAAADPGQLLESPAIRLFVERAQNVQAGFSLDATNAAAIVSICRRVDGLPLAVELAAARVRMFSPQQIAARLDDRFRLLRDGLRSRTAHHVSLEETIAWSYELMSPAEQTMLDRLSVFVGGFTLASAEAVCADETDARQTNAIDPMDVLDLVTSLVDKSLVSPSDERAVIQRFILLDSIRAYGRRRLTAAGLLAEIASRHAAHFAALAVEAGAAIGGPDADHWMGCLQAEHDNLAAAIAQMMEQGDAAAALGFCDALGEYWQVRGHLVEGRDWSERALALSQVQSQPELRDRVVRIAGNLAFEAGDFTAARGHYESTLATADASGDKAAMANARRNLGKVLDELGDYDQASMLQQASLAIMLELGDRWGEAAARNNLGLLDLHRSSPASALYHLTASLTIFRELDLGWAVGVALTNIAVAQLDRGMYDQAQTYLEEALALTRRLGDRVGQAYAATVLGAVACRAGRLDDARGHFAESHPLLREIEDVSAVLEWLEYVAELAKLESRPAQAAVLLGAASTLRHDLRKPVYPRDRDQQQALLDDLCQDLDASAFDTAWAEGCALHWTQALERGLTTA